MTKILLVNGPPRSGKDTVGELIANMTGAVVYKFATALKVGTHGLFYGLNGDLSPVTCAHVTTAAAFEQHKDVEHPRFFGLTPREAYIAVSEVFTKTIFGQSFFGEVLRCQITREHPDLAVITDSGFEPEAQVLVGYYGQENVAILQLYRDGCAFSNASDTAWNRKLNYAIQHHTVRKLLNEATDSRGYVYLDPEHTYHTHNDGTVSELRDRLSGGLLPAIGWR